MNGSHELSSWKEIADYLRVSVRTAQKWECTQELPVRRTPGSKGRVVAVTEDLAHWQDAHVKGVSWWRRAGFLRWYALTVSAALIVVVGHELGSHYSPRARREPATFDIGWNSLTVRNAGGEVLWRKVLPYPFQPHAYTAALMAASPKIRFWDVDMNDHSETLFVYTPESDDQASSTLLCLSDTGGELWRFSPRLELGAGEREVGRFTFITGISPTRIEDGQPGLFVYFCRYPDHAGRLTLLDGHGRQRAVFDNAGHVDHLAHADVDGCGRAEVVLGGVDASSGEAVVILVGLQEGGSPRLLEKARRRFRRTCLSEATEGSNSVAKISASPVGVRVVVRESGGEDPADVVYLLNEQLETEAVWHSDGYRRLHHRLEEEGKIRHRAEENLAVGRGGPGLEAGKTTTWEAQTENPTTP